MTAGSRRDRSANPRARGTDPRATGPNPRARAKASKAASAPRARKIMRLDQALLDEAETVMIALRRVVDNHGVAGGIRALGGRRAVDASRIDD